MRKMVIPYSQFLPGTKILAEHFNTNFDEVEYVFNEMQGDYTEYKKFIQENYMTADNIDLAYDTTFVPGEKIDNEVLGGFVFTDYETGYAFDDEIMSILDDTPHEQALGELVANSIRASFITDEEIRDIVRGDV